MIPRFFTLILTATLLILAAGCISTPPARYYTLNMKPSAAPSDLNNIEIGRIEVSEALARRNLLIKTSATEIEYYASDQWVAGLEELVSEKLALELQDNTSPSRMLCLTGTLLAFEQVDRSGGADARLKMDIFIRKLANNEPVLRKTYEILEPAKATSPIEVVAALSVCMEKLAVQIRADLKSVAANAL